MSAQNLGVRPGLQYVSKSKLQVDHTYQREMSTKRSQHLVERIAAEWSWLHCGAIVVAPAGGGKFNILDGQHRHAAAMKIPEISDLPCVISTARSLIEQARAFIALNRDRIALTGLSIFWSEVAAGDAEGKALVSACRKAGVTILRNTVGGIQMKPDQTVALGVIRRLYRGELDDLPGGGIADRRGSHPVARGLPKQARATDSSDDRSDGARSRQRCSAQVVARRAARDRHHAVNDCGLQAPSERRRAQPQGCRLQGDASAHPQSPRG
jgi:hypothetical protein